MNLWYNILEEISNAKGKEKINIIEKYKNEDLFLDILYFSFNPRIVTGISKKKLNKDVLTYNIDTDEEHVSSLMFYLCENPTGKDSDISFIKSIIESTKDKKEKEWLQKIAIKDLPIGISATSINKVLPNFIPVFKLQKGRLFEGEIEGDQLVSLKLDGNSATVFNLKNETYILSRSGACIENLDHIIDFYREKLPLGYVYQGELIAKNFNNLEHGPLFQYSNGITNSKKVEEKKELQHVIFDVINYDHFEKGKSNVKYIDRISTIDKILEQYDPYGQTYDNVCKIPFYEVENNLDDIMKLANETIKNGLEGLMLCESNSIYKVGKQKWLQKIKEFKTADVLVIDIKEHVRGNKVGSLEVDWKGHKLNVPILQFDLQEKWWNDKNQIIGKIIEIKYFRETKDKHGKLSVRFPSYIRIREDKFEPSYD